MGNDLYWIDNNPDEVDEFGEPLEVYKRVAAYWDIDAQGFPELQEPPCCPVCGGWGPPKHHMTLTRYHFHERLQSATRFRCDVMYKCGECSLVLNFGVALTKEQFEGNDRPNNRGVYNRKKQLDK